MRRVTVSKALPSRAQVRQLSQRVEQLKRNLARRVRPFVIECSGLPRAGKSSCIECVVHFLRRHKLTVFAPTEGASVAPQLIKEDGDLFGFNLWTASYSVARIFEGLHVRQPHPYQFVVLDRGPFDAMCWFEHLHARGEATKDDIRRITRFLRLPALNGIVDLVLLFGCRPAVAAKREIKDRLFQVEGQHATNLSSLKALFRSYRKAADCYEDDFNQIVWLDTTNSAGVRATAYSALSTVVDAVLKHQ